MCKSSLQKLLLAFQYFEESFSLTTVDAESNISRYMSNGDFSLVFMDGSFEEMAITKKIKSFITDNYPRTPLLLIDDKTNPKTGSTIQTSQYCRVVKEPITQVSLAAMMLTALRESYCQGQMMGISLCATLQLIEMDKLSCTLGISHKDTKETGWMFFRDGLPMNAGLGIFEGMTAIKKLVALREVGMTMYNTCPIRENRLNITCSKLVIDQRDALLESGQKCEEDTTHHSKTRPTGLANLFLNVKKSRC